MTYKLQPATLSALTLLIFTVSTWGKQVTQKTETLVINGQTGQAAVIRVDGRAYVDLAALAEIANWSVSFNTNRIVLGPAPNPASAPEPVGPPTQADGSSLSRDFMRAGIEAIAQMREWASPLSYAIQNGYPVTENWVAGYREQAAHALSLASVAATQMLIDMPLNCSPMSSTRTTVERQASGGPQVHERRTICHVRQCVAR